MNYLGRAQPRASRKGRRDSESSDDFWEASIKRQGADNQLKHMHTEIGITSDQNNGNNQDIEEESKQAYQEVNDEMEIVDDNDYNVFDSDSDDEGGFRMQKLREKR